MTLSILRLLGKQFNMAPYITLFDTFQGIDVSVVDPKEEAFWGISAAERRDMYGYHTSVDTIRDRLNRTALDGSKIQIIPGSMPDSLTGRERTKLNQKVQQASSILT